MGQGRHSGDRIEQEPGEVPSESEAAGTLAPRSCSNQSPAPRHSRSQSLRGCTSGRPALKLLKVKIIQAPRSLTKPEASATSQLVTVFNECLSISCRVNNLIPLDVVKYLPSGQSGFLPPSVNKGRKLQVRPLHKDQQTWPRAPVSDRSRHTSAGGAGVTWERCGEKKEGANRPKPPGKWRSAEHSGAPGLAPDQEN